MGKIHWELMEIPIPDDAHINHNDGRVFIFIDDTSKVRESKRKTIGHATSETTMLPNDAFRYIYPGLWKEHYGNEQLPEHVIHSGLYALTLGIGYKTSIYPLLITAYGPLYANAILDFAMYLIREESDVVQTFQGSMSRRLLFSKESYSDTWYSLLFKEKMTSDMCDDFRDQWTKKCKERGMGKVWLSIDGSNNNCEAEKCVLSEKSKAKSGENTNVTSYIYAMNAEDGLLNGTFSLPPTAHSFLQQIQDGGRIASLMHISTAVSSHSRL